MKKILFVILIAGATMIASCKKTLKDVNDYFPEVKTVSAVVNPDGTVEVTGEIISEGNAEIENAGFCLSTDSVPYMLDGQVICNIDGSTFTATYSDFDPYKKYYFRSWATNDYGYVYGNIVALDSIKATPVIAPCTPALNTINIGGGTPTDNMIAQAPVAGIDGWEVHCSGFSYVNSVVFNFGSKPSTKIYTTTTSSNPGADEVNVIFHAGFNSGTLSDGGKVYVNQKNSTSWEISICDAPWTLSSSTLYLTTRFMCPY
ncbi:MAG: hypothetical protein ABI723_11340 [Bacteroidia bacterium]